MVLNLCTLFFPGLIAVRAASRVLASGSATSNQIRHIPITDLAQPFRLLISAESERKAFPSKLEVPSDVLIK